MSDIKRTSLYNQHLKANAKMVDFAGWEMPIQYTSITEEHFDVRNNVGMFDVSHMGEVIVEGNQAFDFVQNLVTNDVAQLVENQVLYAMMCYPDGGVVDDLLVYKYNDKKFMLVINASNVDKDFNWMLENSKGFDVKLDNISPSVSEIALQGQNAQKILQQLTDFDLSTIKFFFFYEPVNILGFDCIVSRTGYTGEDGFEIYTNEDGANTIWEKLIELNVHPIGLGARDTLRFEAALPLYGNELSKTISPLEAGFGYFVKLDTKFIGSDALIKQKENGLIKKIVGIELKGKGIPRHGYPVLNENEEQIGEITTGYVLPGWEMGIALALIDKNYTKLGTPLKVQIRRNVIDAEVVSRKFMQKKYKK